MKKKIIISVVMLCLLLVLPITVSAKQIKQTVYVKHRIQLELPENVKVAPKRMKWRSEKPKIASINQKGMLNPKKAGETKITVLEKKTKKLLAVFKIKVEKFKEEEVSVKYKKYYDYQSFFEESETNYRVLSSRKEVKEFLNEYKDYMQEDLYNALAGYKNKFFKKNVLCLLENTLPGGGMDIEEIGWEKILNDNGKICLQLELTQAFPKDASITCAICYDTYVIELKKSEAVNIEEYSILTHKLY